MAAVSVTGAGISATAAATGFEVRILCPVCHSYCENDDEQRFGILIHDGCEDFVNIPCTARIQLNHMSGLKFKEHDHRYVVDVFRGHSMALIGGDDWVKFKRDFNMCQGKRVVFNMFGQMPHAYVCYVGTELAADHGGPAQDMAGGDVEQEGGVGAFVVDGEEAVINAVLVLKLPQTSFIPGVLFSTMAKNKCWDW